MLSVKGHIYQVCKSGQWQIQCVQKEQIFERRNSFPITFNNVAKVIEISKTDNFENFLSKWDVLPKFSK